LSYSYLDHGADIGLEAEHETLEGVFAEAARGLFSLMVDINGIGTQESVELNLNESTLEDLLYEWLSELVSLSNLKGHAYSEFPNLRIEKDDSEFHLEAQARGTRIDPRRHDLGTEIKAITYQGLEIEERDEGWRCRCVVDV